MKSSRYGLAAPVVALAAAFGLSLSGPHRAQAAPLPSIAQNDSSPAVTILSPVPRTSFSGVKPVEISAFYQGSASNQIVNLELFVDGVKAAQKTLENPESRGVVSFLVDASALTEGTHRVVVRATAADAEVASAKGSFVFNSPVQAPVAAPALPVSPGASLGSPQLSIEDPSVGGQVQGKVTIRMRAEDPSGKPPYVSLFVDRKFKTLRNYAPYEFEWDTTQYPNGYHTIDAFGYNDAQDVGHARSIRVLVNNPGGQTQRRTDLQDGLKTAVPSKAAVKPTLPANIVAIAPAKPARVKSSPILRRPTPAMLAQANPTASAKRALPKTQKIARLPGLLPQQAMALQGQPALSDPFVEMPVMAAPARGATPTQGFKPLMAVAPTAHPRAATGTYLLHAKLGLPNAAVSTPVQTAVRLPAVKASVKAMEAVAAKRTMRVSFPTAKVHAPSVHAVLPHALHTTSQLSWLHAVGQKTLMFNSTRLPLERPLAAQGSVMFGPLRQIFEAGGGSLMWQSRTGVVTARSKDKNVSLTIGQKNAVVNQTPVVLDSAPYLNQGRTMIPLSFLKAAMDVNVQYDAATGHLLVTSK